MITDHADQWMGYPVSLYDPESTPDYANRLYRLALDWDSELDFPELFERFTSGPGSAACPAIVIGSFTGDDPDRSSEEVVQLLVAARRGLPHLRGIFLADIISEENEISWIVQSDLTPLLEAYPALEYLRVRGSSGLSFGAGLHHASLRSLVVESGGLAPNLIHSIARSQLPGLEHLEIWTGSPGYGGDATVADLAPFLDGSAWPRLRSLGLCDCDFADDLAEALRGAPVLQRLEALNLALGTMGDRGGEALLANDALVPLKKLDLHYHFFSDAMMGRLAARFPQADLSDRQDAGGEDDRYVAVSE